MCLLAAVLEVDGLVYPRFQKTRETRKLDGRFDAEFTERTQEDRALYDFARRIYEERFGHLDFSQLIGRPRSGALYLRVQPDFDKGVVVAGLVRFDKEPD